MANFLAVWAENLQLGLEWSPARAANKQAVLWGRGYLPIIPIQTLNLPDFFIFIDDNSWDGVVKEWKRGCLYCWGRREGFECWDVRARRTRGKWPGKRGTRNERGREQRGVYWTTRGRKKRKGIGVHLLGQGTNSSEHRSVHNYSIGHLATFWLIWSPGQSTLVALINVPKVGGYSLSVCPSWYCIGFDSRVSLKMHFSNWNWNSRYGSGGPTKRECFT